MNTDLAGYTIIERKPSKVVFADGTADPEPTPPPRSLTAQSSKSSLNGPPQLVRIACNYIGHYIMSICHARI